MDGGLAGWWVSWMVERTDDWLDYRMKVWLKLCLVR